MDHPPPPASSEVLTRLVARAQHLMQTAPRVLVGLAGAPGAGKSTWCEALLGSLGETAAVVGMDGFHLANEELVRLGQRDRKGAPDTFDVAGYVALLRRLRSELDRTVYGPRFDRTLETAVAGSVPVAPSVRLVLTEGNYLLLDSGGWEGVRPCLDEVWYLEVAADERQRRLVRRRQQSAGETVEQARAWVRDVDEPNAAVVTRTRARADLVIPP